MQWIAAGLFLFGSFMDFVTADNRCRTEVNIPGMALKGFVFKKMSVTAPHECDVRCEREIACQSYNYNTEEKYCELNNRTKEARPENFRSDPARFYIRRLNGRVPLGSIPELPAQSCQEIKASEGTEGKDSISNKYWLDPSGTGKAVLVYCDMKPDIFYNFTTLGAKGRFGPNSNVLYQGTPLEGILVQDGLQTWNVPVTGQYHLELCGATGEDFSALDTNGGRGAKVQGSVHLPQGTQIIVLVGQQGTGGSGGGGTFVVFATDGSPLAVAGGGGAADIVDGDPGQAGSSGSVNAGGPGMGGNVCVSGGSITDLLGVGGGGGLIADGQCYKDSKCNKPCDENDGGKSFNAGGVGGYNIYSQCAGGFGGGGSCGGGGGYSGGGVQVDGNLDLHAGGGGSFVPNADWLAVSGGCPLGDGFASFQIVAVD